MESGGHNNVFDPGVPGAPEEPPDLFSLFTTEEEDEDPTSAFINQMAQASVEKKEEASVPMDLDPAAWMAQENMNKQQQMQQQTVPLMSQQQPLMQDPFNEKATGWFAGSNERNGGAYSSGPSQPYQAQPMLEETSNWNPPDIDAILNETAPESSQVTAISTEAVPPSASPPVETIPVKAAVTEEVSKKEAPIESKEVSSLEKAPIQSPPFQISPLDHPPGPNGLDENDSSKKEEGTQAKPRVEEKPDTLMQSNEKVQRTEDGDSKITKSQLRLTKCSIESKILPTVKAWFEELKKPEWTCSESLGLLEKHTELCSVLGEEKQVDASSVVLKRCGLSRTNSQDLTICSNHLEMLTSRFPMIEKCQVCLREIELGEPGLITVSMAMQDRFQSYFDSVLLGQFVCGDCNSKLNGSRAQARSLLKSGFISREKFNSWMETKIEVSSPKTGNRWVTFDWQGNMSSEKSSVVPLRFLSRGLLPGKVLRSAPELTVKDLMVLRSAQNETRKSEGLSSMSKRLASLGMTHERERIADFFIALVSSLQENNKEKIAFALKLKCDNLLMTPDDVSGGRGILYDTGEGASLLCLVCASWSCAGCSPLGPAKPTVEEGREQHNRVLAVTCRVCARKDESVFHWCEAREMCEEQQTCKYRFESAIKQNFNIDLELEDNYIFPSKLCALCRNSLQAVNGDSLKPAAFEAHNADSCHFCDLNTPMYGVTKLIENQSELRVETEPSKVPSLRLLSTGLASDGQNLEAQDITVITALDIASSMTELINSERVYDAFCLFRRCVETKALPGSSQSAFLSKARSLISLLHVKHHKDEMKPKVMRILQSKYNQCDPWVLKQERGVVLREQGSLAYVCLLCPSSDCWDEGKCQGLAKTNGYKGKDHHLGFNYYHQDSMGSSLGSPAAPVIDSPSTDASYYYISKMSNTLTFDFLNSDYEAVNNFLNCQGETPWSVSESTDCEMVLERSGGLSVVMGIRQNEERTVCKFQGDGMDFFNEELLPSLTKLTSCNYLDLDAGMDESTELIENVKVELEEEEIELEGEPVLEDEDSLMTEPTEHVFIEEGSLDDDDDDDDDNYQPSPSTSSCSPPPGATPTTKAPTSKPKSTRVFECRGCKSKFKYENSYIKHESKCKRAGIPADIRSYPNLKDGRKPCPGCHRGFAGPNIAYLKHLRGCPKVKFNGFPCKTCTSKFSCARTLSKHASACAKYSKKKGVIMPHLTKRGRPGQAQKAPVKANGPPSKPPASRPTVTYKTKTDRHKVICKRGDYRCPLCGANFKLNQPYGKHLKNKECARKKANVKAPDRSNAKMIYVSIYPGTKGDDTVVAHNRIPSLRMICRGVQSKRSLIKVGEIPALTIKEGLEIYYTLKRSDKSVDKDARWKYLTDRFIFQFYGSCTTFNNACNSVLKSVNHFEEKVKGAKRNAGLKKRWNDKLNVFLAMPFADNFNVSQASKFKAYEFPNSEGGVGVVCFNCPDVKCGGCHTSKVRVEIPNALPAASPVQAKGKAVAKRSAQTVPYAPPVKKRKELKPIPAVNKASSVEAMKRTGSANQQTYFGALKKWISKEQLKKEYGRIGKILGYKRPASLTEVIRFEQGHLRPKPVPILSHHCTNCTRTFESKSGLVAHQRTCLAPSQLPKPDISPLSTLPKSITVTPVKESDSEAKEQRTTEAAEPEPGGGEQHQETVEEQICEPEESTDANYSPQSPENNMMPWMLPAEDCSPEDDECILPD